jgi:hypothetical protein
VNQLRLFIISLGIKITIIEIMANPENNPSFSDHKIETLASKTRSERGNLSSPLI